MRTPHVMGTVTTTTNSVTSRHKAAEVDSVNKKNVVKFTLKNALDERTRSAEEWEVAELGDNIPRNCVYTGTPLHWVLQQLCA